MKILHLFPKYQEQQFVRRMREYLLSVLLLKVKIHSYILCHLMDKVEKDLLDQKHKIYQ